MGESNVLDRGEEGETVRRDFALGRFIDEGVDRFGGFVDFGGSADLLERGSV
jgi:hypothetical protein